MTRASIAELLETGIALTAVEAVAIARAALSTERATAGSEMLPDVPLPDRIFVEPDGTITCQPGGTPSIPDVARLLRGLLPSGGPGVPGGLRYAIARALGEVEAPPFESTDDFSNTLARFQTAAGPEVGQGMLARIDTDEGLKERVRVERRRPKGATVSNLRHALREADSRLYEQQRSVEPAGPAKPSHLRLTASIAAGAIGAVALFAAGAATRARLAPEAAPADAPAEIVRPLPVIAADIVLEPPVRQAAKAKVRATKPAPHTTSHTASQKTRDKDQDKDKGFFARLRLGWLKRAFS
jgi:hypothetical protein